MSTPGSPGFPSQPAAGWLPNLDGLNLPGALTNGITQSFQLTYSLRDTVNQQAAAMGRMQQYGTHLARTQTNPQAVPDGALWFETDRATAFYQARLSPPATTRAWLYAGGIMYGATQPSDLGANDVGFLFLNSSNNSLYRWNGTAWSMV